MLCFGVVQCGVVREWEAILLRLVFRVCVYLCVDGLLHWVSSMVAIKRD